MTTLPVAILAGGLATRLRPITQQIPKALVEVAGSPFIVHQLELLKRHGLSRVVLCVGHLGEMIEATLGNGKRWGMELHYVFDGDTLLGTGGALRNALPWLGDQFLVMYGDSYLDCDYQSVIKAFLTSGQLGLMTVFRNANQWDRSNLVFHAGQILVYDKHQQTADMQYIDYGLGALHAKAITSYPENMVLDLAKVYQDLLATNELAGCEVTQRFYEIGSPAGLEETRRYFLEKTIKL
ncbi:MAG: nucleotidyl transferase [Thiotrichaceae bacterium IS1]|nr:MAG: nucleotidyl transferase [Thiotrichaceae bacterium IS1]